MLSLAIYGYPAGYPVICRISGIFNQPDIRCPAKKVSGPTLEKHGDAIFFNPISFLKFIHISYNFPHLCYLWMFCKFFKLINSIFFNISHMIGLTCNILKINFRKLSLISVRLNYNIKFFVRGVGREGITPWSQKTCQNRLFFTY